ncbi:MAG: hypothetical protein Fur002_25330 [Anaerolineales bacterium]
MTTIVSLDIETTGLDEDRDAIIEIGAVKFKNARKEDEYTVLLNPGKRIPDHIAALTNIDDSMVRGAPRLRDIEHELTAFVGDAPILGHNVKFDIGFLRKAGLFLYQQTLDTYELASALMPTASRYNLGSLAQQLHILLPATHRALDDARVTHACYVKLVEMAQELPLETLQQIAELSQMVAWDAGWVFEQALSLRLKDGIQAKRIPAAKRSTGRIDSARQNLQPLEPAAEITPLNVDEVASILEYGGPFSQYFQAYEHRPEQVDMLRAVADALSQGQHLMVEAGTGVGKCLTGDAWITFKSGKRKQIKEIAESETLPSEPILSVSADGKLIWQKIQAVHKNGIRPVWRLTTGLGHKITATSNHPLLTFDGWKTLGELKFGERIASIRSLPIGDISYPSHEPFIAGVMLGDGGCGRPDSLNFTNFDSEVVERVRQNVAKFKDVKLVDRKIKGHYGFRRLSLMGHERSGLNLLLEELGILGHTAANKAIPAAYFESDRETICQLLAGLWVTDGCIEGVGKNISIASASEQLIFDIQHLLLRLGIIARARYKSVRLGAKRFDSWSLSILDVQNKRLFSETVGKYMAGKRKKQIDEWYWNHQNDAGNPNDDLIPSEAWAHVDEARREEGKSWNAIRRECIAASDRQREISRNKMLSMAEFLSSDDLMEMATSDLYWDRVASIEAVGEAETFDLTMDGEPNFVANDIVVHNSFAYLIPAALFAMQNNTRVVISTNTINLQDQLIKKDVPDLQAALNLDVRAAVLKGRANYLCPRKFEYLRKNGAKDANEMRVLAKILIWQLDNASGDRNEINLTGPVEREIWNRLSAEDDTCTTEMCMTRMGGSCPFQRAKQAAQNAHLLIVNHALLLSDAAANGKVLPEHEYVIIDEAHHMENAVTGALSFRLTQAEMERMFKELGGSSSGVLGRILTETHNALRPSDFGLLQQKSKRGSEQLFRLEQMTKEFFNILNDFIAIQREGQPFSSYSWQLRITPAARTLQGWDDVEIMWGQISETFSLLLKTLDEIYKTLADLFAKGHDELDDVMGSLTTLTRRMTEAEAAASGMIHKPSADTIYWIEVNPRGERLSLNAAPLRVGPLVQKHLWHAKTSVIMASATLTTHGDFTYLRNTLFAEEASVLSLGSPFDYESSALLYVANDMPEPNAPNYQQVLDRTLIATAKATGGRMLVLFTSYAALKKTSQAITTALARDDIAVFEQNEGASPNALLESFKTTERAVLLGTRSFWEGVDVQGDALSVVVITKLPFAVPSDPIIAARSELYEDSFNEYYLPESILKFRQGFGRLIRSASDRGVVAILDRRVLTKQYGRLFLESLPQCTARQGAAASLSKMAGDWLGA